MVLNMVMTGGWFMTFVLPTLFPNISHKTTNMPDSMEANHWWIPSLRFFVQRQPLRRNRRQWVFRQPPGWDWTKQIPTTLCFFNIAMENRSFIDDFCDGLPLNKIKNSDSPWFSIATSNYQGVIATCTANPLGRSARKPMPAIGHVILVPPSAYVVGGWPMPQICQSLGESSSLPWERNRKSYLT